MTSLVIDQSQPKMFVTIVIAPVKEKMLHGEGEWMHIFHIEFIYNKRILEFDENGRWL